MESPVVLSGFIKMSMWGCLGSAVVEHLPLAQGMIPGSGIESHIRLLVGSLLLPLPVSLSISLSLMNKLKKKDGHVQSTQGHTEGCHISHGKLGRVFWGDDSWAMWEKCEGCWQTWKWAHQGLSLPSHHYSKLLLILQILALGKSLVNAFSNVLGILGPLLNMSTVPDTFYSWHSPEIRFTFVFVRLFH